MGKSFYIGNLPEEEIENRGDALGLATSNGWIVFVDKILRRYKPWYAEKFLPSALKNISDKIRSYSKRKNVSYDEILSLLENEMKKVEEERKRLEEEAVRNEKEAINFVIRELNEIVLEEVILYVGDLYHEKVVEIPRENVESFVKVYEKYIKEIEIFKSSDKARIRLRVDAPFPEILGYLKKHSKEFKIFSVYPDAIDNIVDEILDKEKD